MPPYTTNIINNSKQNNKLANGYEMAPLALYFYFGPQLARKGDDCMRKYSMANSACHGVVDLRDDEEIIVSTVLGFVPGTTVTVTNNESLTQSQAVRIGRRICESSISQDV